MLDLSLALCNALEYLHDVAVPGRIVCHRDLKPDNIGFAEDGTLKLIDFGLGKVRRENGENEREGLAGMQSQQSVFVAVVFVCCCLLFAVCVAVCLLFVVCCCCCLDP